MAYGYGKSSAKGKRGRDNSRGNARARGGRGQSSGGRGAASAYGDDAAPAQRMYAVKPDQHLSKSALRHYCGEQGPFFLQGSSDEASFWDPRAVSRTRDGTNCEGMNRLGFFLSFFATTMETGVDALNVVDPDNAAAQDMAGLTDLQQVFASPEGQQFVEACQYLNAKGQMTRSRADTTEHIKKLFGFLGEDPESLHASAAKFASASARMYLFATNLIEMLSLLLDMKHWADSVPRDAHPPAVGRWKSQPMNFDFLVGAFQAVFEERLADERQQRSGGGTSSRLRFGGDAQNLGTQGAGSLYGDEDDEEHAECDRADEDDDNEVAAAPQGKLWQRRTSASAASKPDRDAGTSDSQRGSSKRGAGLFGQSPKAPKQPRAAKGVGAARPAASSVASDKGSAGQRGVSEQAAQAAFLDWALEDIDAAELALSEAKDCHESEILEPSHLVTMLEALPENLRTMHKLPKNVNIIKEIPSAVASMLTKADNLIAAARAAHAAQPEEAVTTEVSVPAATAAGDPFTETFVKSHWNKTDYAAWHLTFIDVQQKIDEGKLSAPLFAAMYSEIPDAILARGGLNLLKSRLKNSVPANLMKPRGVMEVLRFIDGACECVFENS